MANTSSEFQAAFEKFMVDAQAVVDEYMTTHFPSLPREVLSPEPGRRYIRVTRNHGNGVYCFVDTTNGDILKAETWKKPAKHARGNIFTYENITDCVNHFGAHYMR